MPLQSAQNATTQLLLGFDHQSSITTALRVLHWLPVKHHITFNTPSSLLSLSIVLGWPHCVQLNLLTMTALLHYDQSSCDTASLDPVRKTGFLYLRS